VSSPENETRSGWMTPRDAELFRVLARGLTDDERSHLAHAIARVDTEADQQVRSNRRHNPSACSETPTQRPRGSTTPDDRLAGPG
jgi:hypothetical protein